MIDSLNISGNITVTHDNVTIRKCRITTPSTTPNCIDYVGATRVGLLIEDCEIIGSDTGANWTSGGIYTEGQAEAYRCNVYGQENCVAADKEFYAEDCYFHDPVLWADHQAADPHIDTVQIWEGAANVSLVHCTLQADGDASSVFTAGVNQVNLLVSNCLIYGGFITFRVGENGSVGSAQVINNKFSTQMFPLVGSGDLWSLGSGGTFTGNEIYETSEDCDPPWP